MVGRKNHEVEKKYLNQSKAKKSQRKSCGDSHEAGSNKKLQASECSAVVLHTENLFLCPKLRWNLRNMDFEAIKWLQQLQHAACKTKGLNLVAAFLGITIT